MILKCLLLWLGKEYKGEKKESQSILDLEKVKKKRVQGSSHCDQIRKKSGYMHVSKKVLKFRQNIYLPPTYLKLTYKCMDPTYLIFLVRYFGNFYTVQGLHFAPAFAGQHSAIILRWTQVYLKSSPETEYNQENVIISGRQNIWNICPISRGLF